MAIVCAPDAKSSGLTAWSPVAVRCDAGADRALEIAGGTAVWYHNGFETNRERLASVTPAEVGRLASSHLKPDALTIVAVGYLKTIEARIRALTLGTVDVWGTEGKKLK